MAVNPRELGHAPAPSETQVPADNHETVLFDPARDNVGLPDFAAFAQSPRLTPDTPLIEELHGFAAYRDAGGRFSEGLHRYLMAKVEKLKESGERERSEFRTPTIAQVEGFAYRHNNPLGPKEPLPLEEQITFTQEQIDAYCLLRENRLEIPEEDEQNGTNPAKFSDQSIIRELQKMPLLNPQKEQPQALPVAA